MRTDTQAEMLSQIHQRATIDIPVFMERITKALERMLSTQHTTLGFLERISSTMATQADVDEILADEDKLAAAMDEEEASVHAAIAAAEKANNIDLSDVRNRLTGFIARVKGVVPAPAPAPEPSPDPAPVPDPAPAGDTGGASSPPSEAPTEPAPEPSPAPSEGAGTPPASDAGDSGTDSTAVSDAPDNAAAGSDASAPDAAGV